MRETLIVVNSWRIISLCASLVYSLCVLLWARIGRTKENERARDVLSICHFCCWYYGAQILMAARVSWNLITQRIARWSSSVKTYRVIVGMCQVIFRQLIFWCSSALFSTWWHFYVQQLCSRRIVCDSGLCQMLISNVVAKNRMIYDVVAEHSHWKIWYFYFEKCKRSFVIQTIQANHRFAQIIWKFSIWFWFRRWFNLRPKL